MIWVVFALPTQFSLLSVICGNRSPTVLKKLNAHIAMNYIERARVEPVDIAKTVTEAAYHGDILHIDVANVPQENVAPAGAGPP